MLTILHSNDLHGSLGMLPRLAGLIEREREQNPNALLLDAGDTALGGPTAELGVQLLSSLRYTAMTPGNHENDVLEHRTYFSHVRAPVVVANIPSGALACATLPYLLEQVGGIQVAILGLTTPPPYAEGHPLHRPDAREVPVTDPVAAARHWVPRLRQEANLVVLLSHLGLARDIRLALEVPGIDLIVGGHSHHRLPALLRAGDTAIAHGGISGAYLGVITIEATASGFRYAGRLDPIWEPIQESEGAQQIIRAFTAQRWPAAAEVVGATDGCWADPWTENRWSSFVTDSLRERTGAQICFTKAPMLLPALAPGPITRWDLHRCLPWYDWTGTEGGEEPIVTMQLSGESIRAICEHAVSDLPWDQHEGVPPSFCLPAHNLLYPSGLQVRYDLSRPQGGRVTSLSVDGNGVTTRRHYRVATTGFLARGYSGFHWFREGENHQVVGSLQDLLLAAVRTSGTLPDTDGRLQFSANEKGNRNE
jgi:2',3'-cyclic-nucleotide 2'-phosphodiesterase (5'-nucleotidase family)